MMSQKRQHVTIKGTKDGLVFQLDDYCAYSSLLKELQEKLSSKHYKDAEGRKTDVIVDSGNRYLVEKQKEEITNIITSGRNLIVKAFHSRVLSKEEAEQERQKSQIVTLTRMIRSGQVVKVTGDVILIGDVNPGGTIMATGNIYIMGALRGVAHAGYEGDDEAVIIASLMAPAQLKISEKMKQFHMEEDDECLMATAYLSEQITIHIGHVHELIHIRPELTNYEFK